MCVCFSCLYSHIWSLFHFPISFYQVSVIHFHSFLLHYLSFIPVIVILLHYLSFIPLIVFCFTISTFSWVSFLSFCVSFPVSPCFAPVPPPRPGLVSCSCVFLLSVLCCRASPSRVFFPVYFTSRRLVPYLCCWWSVVYCLIRFIPLLDHCPGMSNVSLSHSPLTHSYSLFSLCFPLTPSPLLLSSSLSRSLSLPPSLPLSLSLSLQINTSTLLSDRV